MLQQLRKMAAREHKSTVIFLHGLGDCGESWRSELAHRFAGHVKCVCPTAPSQPVTLNMGLRMPSWFDIRGLDADDAEDEAGIERACSQVHALIEAERAAGVPPERLVLAGFSQGGALALFAALTFPERLAGAVGLSCWLPLHRRFPARASAAGLSTPVLQCHGDQDHIVSLEWGRRTRDLLQGFVADKRHYTFELYPGLGHGSSAAELASVTGFVAAKLPPV